MLEIRYNQVTKQITGWCGDNKQFGNLDRGYPNEVITQVDKPLPAKSCRHYKFDQAILAINEK